MAALMNLVLIFILAFGSFAEATEFQLPREELQLGIGYIKPNERQPQLSNSYLRNKKGVLVVVGTFRALHSASIGQFEEAYLLDINESVCQFNSRHLSLFSTPSDRIDYLSTLFGSSELKAKFDAFERRKISSDELRAALTTAAQQLKKGSFQNEDGYLNQMIEFILDPQVYYNTFLGNDEYFSRLKNLVDNNKIFVVTGSLSGPKVMKWLAKKLRTQNLQISVLDISNSEDYISQRKQYLQNLESLPFAYDGVILKTWDGDLGPGVVFGHNWTYSSVRANEFLGRNCPRAVEGH